MNWKSEWKTLFGIIALFLLAFFMPLNRPIVMQSIHSALELSKWYAREHVLLCLVPAFFIAGVIAVFISQAAVIKYFGAQAKKWVAYTIAATSGTFLAVCSCTILPLFASIHKKGAGIGPAIAFLYSGPAINILAIILTARILGWELGIARIIGAVLFSIIIGLLMHVIYRREEREKASATFAPPQEKDTRPLWQTAWHFFTLVAILVFATWGDPQNGNSLLQFVYQYKWILVGASSIMLGFSLVFIVGIDPIRVLFHALPVVFLALFFSQQPLAVFVTGIIMLSLLLSRANSEAQEWMSSTWGFTKQILPLLAAGVLIAGFLLGTPEGGNGILPETWIARLVGGNSLTANFFASIVGSFMYFATLTEIPILQGLISSGMGKGPALALLLAGPAVSLPNMLVIRSVMGTQKTIVFVSLVITLSAASGWLYGILG